VILDTIGGFGGIPFWQSWHDVWVSLDDMGRMFRVRSSQPTDSCKKPFTKVSFFTNFLVFAKDRDDETIPFSHWPDDVDKKRCFVVATHENTYYFVAKDEEEKM